jgi:hypothetical protein
MGDLASIDPGCSRLRLNASPSLVGAGFPDGRVDATVPVRGETAVGGGRAGHHSVMSSMTIAGRTLMEWPGPTAPVDSLRRKSPIRHQAIRRRGPGRPQRQPACEPSRAARPSTTIHMINTMMMGDDEMRRYT